MNRAATLQRVFPDSNVLIEGLFAPWSASRTRARSYGICPISVWSVVVTQVSNPSEVVSLGRDWSRTSYTVVVAVAILASLLLQTDEIGGQRFELGWLE